MNNNERIQSNNALIQECIDIANSLPDAGEGGGQYEEYTGDYNVTPKVTEQVLLTKNKVMVNDLTVKSIPFYNVSNTSGGNTVYIGNEV